MAWRHRVSTSRVRGRATTLAWVALALGGCRSAPVRLRPPPALSALLRATLLSVDATRVGDLHVSAGRGRATRVRSGGWLAVSDLVIENRGVEPARFDPEVVEAEPPYVFEPTRTTLRPTVVRPGERVHGTIAWRAAGVPEAPNRLRVSGDQAGAAPIEVAFDVVTDAAPLAGGWLAAVERVERATRPTIAVLSADSAHWYYNEDAISVMVRVANDTNDRVELTPSSFVLLFGGERAMLLTETAKDPGTNLRRASYYCRSGSPLVAPIALGPGESQLRTLCFAIPTAAARHDATLAFAPDVRSPTYTRVRF